MFVLAGAADTVMVLAVAAGEPGAGAGGSLAGTIRPGGPRIGSICGALTEAAAGPGGPEGILAPFKPAVAGLVPAALFCSSGASPAVPSPSTKANRPSFLSLSRSSPAPFLASCFQNSYSLIHDTSTTWSPSSPPSCEVLLSASHRNRMSSQFALAPSVLVSRRSESSRGRWM